MTPTDARVDKLITDAMSAAIRTEQNGVCLYDYAVDMLKRNHDHLVETYSPSVDDAHMFYIEEKTYAHAVSRLTALRDVYIAEEAEWMLERAPLRQGHVRDGVVDA